MVAYICVLQVGEAALEIKHNYKASGGLENIAVEVKR